MKQTHNRRSRLVQHGLLTLLFLAGMPWLSGVHAQATQEQEPAPVIEQHTISLDANDAPIATLLEDLGDDVAIFDQHVVTLANPFFEGRGATTPKADLAADYIRFYYEQLGLEPAFSTTTKAADGSEVITRFASYLQPFDPMKVRSGRSSVPKAKVLDSEVGISVGDGAWGMLVPDVEYTVLGSSGSGEVEGPVVFVGYSIAAGANGYLGYPPGKDLSGKIAVAFRYEPLDENGASAWSDDGTWTMYAALEPKIAAAARRGASAVIIINPPGAMDPNASKLATTQQTNSGAFDIPVIMMSQERAAYLLGKADPEHRSLEELRKLVDTTPAVIDMPGARVRIKTTIDRTVTMTSNVGALLRGKGPLAREIVVIGAHYDHAGHGEYGGKVRGVIHPGADDNASGTAAVLLAAKHLKAAYDKLDEDANVRSILFLNFSAEEWGLLGSKYYCEHPAAPIGEHVLMLNMDMIGRVRDNTLYVGGQTTAQGLDSWVEPMLTHSGFHIQPMPQGVFGRSDHASFFAQGVPTMFFFSGFHEQYHSPGDVSSLINRVGAVRVEQLVETIAMAMAGRPERLIFRNDNGTGVKPRNQPPALGQQRAPKVRFGVRPMYTTDGQGVPIEAVAVGTSAAEAGLQEGDVIVSWNGTKVGSVEDWMPLLAKANPGDKVEVGFLRDGIQHTTTAILKPAK